MLTSSAQATMPWTCPERELLLCCSCLEMDGQRAERLDTLLHSDLNWDLLLALARRNGLMPLLYRHLKEVAPELFPGNIRDQLRNFFHLNSMRNLAMTSELLRLLKLFAAQNVPMFAYKGPVLAQFVYGNIALRQYHDLDVLIHRQDIQKVRELMRLEGYQPAEHPDYALEFFHPEKLVAIEVHWELTGFTFPGQGSVTHFFSPFNPSPLWTRLEPVSLLGAQVLSLAPEDLLLFLCVHGSKHGWYRLAWICDVAELLRMRRDMEWGKVLEQAQSLGCKRMLFLGLYLAHTLLGAELPEDMLTTVSGDSAVRTLASEAYPGLPEATARLPRRLDPLLESLGIAPTLMEEIHLYIRLRERLRDKMPCLLHCVRLIFTPTAQDRAWVALPARLTVLYYPLRCLRLAGKLGRGITSARNSGRR